MGEQDKKEKVAIVGGGIAGLATAYHLIKANPNIALDIYDRGDAQSYNAGDASRRASLGHSPARIIRYLGSEPGVGQWVVGETLAMLRDVEDDMAKNPADYPGLEGRKILQPQAASYIAKDKSDANYQKFLKSLQAAGVPHAEISGRQLKERFPGMYDAMPDDAAVLLEEPARTSGVEKAAAGVMDMPVFLQALRAYVKKRGANLRDGEKVSGVTEKDGKVIVESKGSGASDYDRAVIAPGQWIEKLVDTKSHGINVHFERVVAMDIDMKGLGVDVKTVPFSGGYAPGQGEGSVYSQLADSQAGHVKFLPNVTIRKNVTYKELKEPVNEQEREAALKAAADRFGIPVEKLRPHVKFSSCTYTMPPKQEKPLVDKLSERIVLNGIDSSGSARVSGGLGKIAAAKLLGLEEPQPGAFHHYCINTHRKLAVDTPVQEQHTAPAMADDGAQAIRMFGEMIRRVRSRLGMQPAASWTESVTSAERTGGRNR